MKKEREQNGRYKYSDMKYKCVCGHLLGEHDAERTKDKQYCQHIDENGDICDCEYFTKINKLSTS